MSGSAILAMETPVVRTGAMIYGAEQLRKFERRVADHLDQRIQGLSPAWRERLAPCREDLNQAACTFVRSGRQLVQAVACRYAGTDLGVGALILALPFVVTLAFKARRSVQIGLGTTVGVMAVSSASLWIARKERIGAAEGSYREAMTSLMRGMARLHHRPLDGLVREMSRVATGLTGRVLAQVPKVSLLGLWEVRCFGERLEDKEVLGEESLYNLFESSKPLIQDLNVSGQNPHWLVREGALPSLAEAMHFIEAQVHEEARGSAASLGRLIISSLSEEK